jgi:RNA polymerase sigma-70 factor (ECF subfamily)
MDNGEMIARSKRHRRLIVAAIKGDREALGRLYKEYRDFICHYCSRLVYKGVSAEAAEAEVALRMVMRIPTLKDPTKFIGWLYSIIRYTCMELNREELSLRSYLRELDERSVAAEHLLSSPQEALEEHELTHMLLKAITSLPRRQRQVAEAFYLEQLSYDEIEKRHAISQGSIAKTLNQARANLRQTLSAPEYLGLKTGASLIPWMTADLEAELFGGAALVTKALPSGISLGAGLTQGACALLAALGIFALGLQLSVEAPPAEGAAYVADGASVFVADEPEEDGIEDASLLRIVFEGAADTGHLRPERYNPGSARFVAEDWQPVGWSIVDDRGVEVRSLANSSEASINIPALGLEAGEYTLYWKARSGAAGRGVTATVTRSFVVGF